MPTERVQRRIDQLLDQADEAIERTDWETVVQRAKAVLAFESENEDALQYLKAAQHALNDDFENTNVGTDLKAEVDSVELNEESNQSRGQPDSFGGCCQ